MEKSTILKLYGDTKIQNIAGILHNYTINGTLSESLALEDYISKNGHILLKNIIEELEEFLEFE